MFRIIIVLQLEVLPGNPSQMIGSPSNVDSASASAASTPAPAPQQQATPQQNNYNNRPQEPQQANFYGQGQGQGQQQQNVYNPNAQGQDAFSPIASLTPYRSRWTIKARVTAKGDMRTWTNQKGEGKLFSVDLLDNEGGQIRATMFNDAADKFYPVFQQDKVYVISKAQLKLANKKFNRLPNEYELTLNADAEVSFFGEDNTIQQQKFDFVNIGRIQEIKAEEFVDIIGIAKAITPISTLISKNTQRELKKRVITLTDSSLMAVDLTMWGEQAEKFNEDVLANNPVFAAKACKVSEFGGRSLNSSFSSHFFVNPDIKETKDLREWYDSKGVNAQVVSISESRSGGSSSDPRKTFAAIRSEQLGFGEKPDYFTVRGTITFFQHDPEKPPWYNACPTPKCNKKVTHDESNNTWYCDKCAQPFPSCEPRYILRFLACDGSGSEWLTAFNDPAELLVKQKAAQLNVLKDEDRSAYEAVFSGANFQQYIFKIRAKAENVQDALQLKCSVIKAEPVNFKAESRFLLDEINAY